MNPEKTTEPQDGQKLTTDRGLAASPCSLFHVWLVDGHFYAAETLREAREYSAGDWGTEMDEQQWDDDHCDNSGFHRGAVGWDDHDENNPDCTMRERALEMIAEGESPPFIVGIELN